MYSYCVNSMCLFRRLDGAECRLVAVDRYRREVRLYEMIRPSRKLLESSKS